LYLVTAAKTKTATFTIIIHFERPPRRNSPFVLPLGPDNFCQTKFSLNCIPCKKFSLNGCHNSRGIKRRGKTVGVLLAWIFPASQGR
jgi:hypothetical protein